MYLLYIHYLYVTVPMFINKLFFLWGIPYDSPTESRVGLKATRNSKAYIIVDLFQTASPLIYT